MSKNVTESYPPNDPQIERFWDKVEVRGPGECWLWLAGKFAKGYGAFAYAGYRPGYAHRFSYLLHHGEISKGAFVMHSCDTPACVNPNHLQLGTASDNARDSVSKGRWMTEKRRKHLNRLHEGNTGWRTRALRCVVREPSVKLSERSTARMSELSDSKTVPEVPKK